MKRITPDEVLAARAARPHMQVVTKRFGDRETCGCPLTLYALHNGMDPYKEASVTAWLRDVRGFSLSYLWGFAGGVDGLEHRDGNQQGYDDGAAVRRSLSLP